MNDYILLYGGWAVLIGVLILDYILYVRGNNDNLD